MNKFGGAEDCNHEPTEQYEENRYGGIGFHFRANISHENIWRSATEWIKLRQKLKSPQEDVPILSEALHGHLLVTPASHFIPQKARVLFLVELLQVDYF